MSTALISKVAEGHRGHDFKEGQLAIELAFQFGDLLAAGGERILRNHHTVDGDALAQVGQVGAGVQAHGVAAAFQHTSEHGAG